MYVKRISFLILTVIDMKLLIIRHFVTGSCELERLNHLPWVVKVIQITSFRVVIQKVIQILPNLARSASVGDRCRRPRIARA